MSKTSITYTTPRGTANYPWLNRPSPTYNRFGLELNLPKSDARDLILKIRKVAEVFKGSNWRKPYFPSKDDPAEQITFRISSRYQPKLFDVHGRPISDPASVWAGPGSIVRVEVSIEAYSNGDKGVALRPSAVQIIKAVSKNGHAPEDAGSGFEDESAPAGAFGDATAELEEWEQTNNEAGEEDQYLSSGSCASLDPADF
jgi:hypothetical protein